MKKSLAAVWLLALLLSALVGCARQRGPATDGQLRSVLAKASGEKAGFFRSTDLGGGQKAAFAIAGGTVWYVTASGAQKLKDGVSGPEEGQGAFLWTVEGVSPFKCETFFGSSSLSCAWYIKDGKPVALPYTGMNLTYTGGGRFTTDCDTFDAAYTDGMLCGHTYKPYYLYWPDGGLREYGGLKITERQLLGISGARPVVEAVTKAGNFLDDIYVRANGILNVNYHSGDKRNGALGNVTLVYRKGAVTPQPAAAGKARTESLTAGNLSDFSYGGIYGAALFPQIATYPDGFRLQESASSPAA